MSSTSLHTIDGCVVRHNVSAGRLTTMGVGGPLETFIEVQGVSALQTWRQRNADVPVRTLGNGSNVVICDGGIPDPVLQLGREFSRYYRVSDRAFSISDPLELLQLQEHLAPESETDDGSVAVLAFGAAPLMTLSRVFSQQGLSGLEFAAGIPGSLGGGVCMNAGAHHSMISDVLASVVVLDRAGELRLLSAEKLRFAYRHADIPEGAIVVAGLIRMKHGDREAILKRRAECLDYRKRTQPLHLPSSGSVFRNPARYQDEIRSTGSSQYSAAALIERCQLKGHRVGGAMISDMHSNWIVRVDPNATASDVKELISLAERRVFEQFGETLQPEILFWEKTTRAESRHEASAAETPSITNSNPT